MNNNDPSNNKLKDEEEEKSKSKSGRASGLTLDGVDGCPRVGEEECRFCRCCCFDCLFGYNEKYSERAGQSRHVLL
jgi:hypothetical protein